MTPRHGRPKRIPYALRFVDRLSAEDIKNQRRRYTRYSKADIFDCFADLVRQIQGEDKNVKDIFNELESRRMTLVCNDMR